MRLQRLFWRITIPQIPHQNNRFLIVTRRRRQLGAVIRIPRNRTNRLSAQIVERQTLLLGSCIPDCCEATTAAGDEDMCYFLVPVKGIEVVGAGYCCA